MKATLERREGWEAVVLVEVEPERVEVAMEEASRRLARRVRVPGFRPGRAPRAVLERHVGREAVWREAADELFAAAVAEAAEELGLEPIDRPDIDVVSRGDGEPLRFRATLPVKPEVRLGDYRSMAVPRPQAEVSQEDVERVLTELRERHAILRPLEGEAAPGHVIRFSYRGRVGRRGVASGEEGRLARLGAGELVPALEEVLVGARPGDEREVAYRVAATGGREEEVRLTVRLLEVAEKVLPELDDDFARGVGHYEDLAALREDVTRRLRKVEEREAAEHHRADVLARLVEQAEVAIPPVLVERRLQAVTKRWFREARALGLTPEQYRQAQGMATDEELAQRLYAMAAAEVRAELVLDALATAEGIQVSEAEVEERLGGAAPDEVRSAARSTIMREKALAWLADLAAANAGEAASS